MKILLFLAIIIFLTSCKTTDLRGYANVNIGSYETSTTLITYAKVTAPTPYLVNPDIHIKKVTKSGTNLDIRVTTHSSFYEKVVGVLSGIFVGKVIPIGVTP